MTKKPRRRLRSHPFKKVQTTVETEVQVEISEQIDRPMSEPQSQPVGFAWLTLEWLLYALIFAVALGLRLWQLGAYPLSDIEAQQSLLALALYHGDLPDAGQYNPLLVSLNALTFLLLGSSDASARLAAVLLGMLLVILPMTLRRQLGVWVSLLASGLLAISPIAIFFSRTLNSEVGVAAGALMVMTGFLNWITDRQQRWLLLQATGLALMLAAGPMAFSMLIIFGLIVFLQFPALKVLWASSEVESGNASRRAGIFFVVALILFSTAALFNLSGLGVLTTNLPNWFNRFGLTPQPNAGFNAVFSLTIYESLLIFAGLAGLAMTIVRRNLLMVTFSIWFIGLLVLDIVMVGRPNSNVVLLVVPLAFLAASALAELREGLKQYATWQNEGLILVAGLAIAGFGYIGLTGWVFRTCGSDDLFCQYAWLQAIAALALFLIIAITFWYMSGGGVTIRGLALTGVAIGLLITINTGWRLNYGPLMHLAYQPLANTPASTELVMLSDILARQSAERVGDETLLDVTLAGVDSPALQWQLHKYRHLQEGTNIDAPATAIITPAETELSLDQPYLGQDFALNAHWSPVGLPPKALLKWLIYRRADTQPNGEEVILWLRVTDN